MRRFATKRGQHLCAPCVYSARAFDSCDAGARVCSAGLAVQVCHVPKHGSSSPRRSAADLGSARAGSP
eukprot:5042929-Pyramimonas_sp.AAC.1